MAVESPAIASCTMTQRQKQQHSTGGKGKQLLCVGTCGQAAVPTSRKNTTPLELEPEHPLVEALMLHRLGTLGRQHFLKDFHRSLLQRPGVPTTYTPLHILYVTVYRKTCII